MWRRSNRDRLHTHTDGGTYFNSKTSTDCDPNTRSNANPTDGVSDQGKPRSGTNIMGDHGNRSDNG